MRHRPECRAANSPDLIILIQPLNLYASIIAYRIPSFDKKLDTSGLSNTQLTRFRQHLAAIARPSYNRGLYTQTTVADPTTAPPSPPTSTATTRRTAETAA